MTQYKEIHLIERPGKKPIGPDLFKVHEKEIPEVKDGEVLVKQTYMSMDPAMMGWMSPDTNSYIPPVELGTVMRSSGYGEVVESKNSKFSAGDKVMGMMGWTEYFLGDGQGLRQVSKELEPEMALSVFALPGLTATQGLFNVGKPQKGETLVVSGAAGSVGSIVGQLAKAEGLRVVGVAGTDEKCAWIVKDLGFDAAVNYKSDDLEKQLENATPDGIDLYFENTGGAIQSLVFHRMNAHGRIVVCGMIADYTSSNPSPGPNWIPIIKQRLTVQGFTMPDHYDKMPQLLDKLTPYVMAGKIKYRAHVLDGLTSAMTALNMFLSGDNKGKLMIKL